MNVGSLFSGIGGLDYGLARAGFRHAFFCESDAYRRDVLAARWPGVPIYDDVRQVNAATLSGRCGTLGTGGVSADAERDGHALPVEPVHAHLLCGGFPCQDLSVAGQRRGLAGNRSGLFHEYARIANTVRPGWLLVENVPGLLSSNGGRDFGVVLGTLADLGYGLAWRILDSRYFGVPQRRRRVFIVGAFANDDPRAASERAGQVLAVGSRCTRHPATRGETRTDVAGTLGNGSGDGGRSTDLDGHGAYIVNALTSKMVKGTGGPSGDECQNLIALLSHGSNPNSNPAGRRREDDFNLVAGPLGGGNDGTGRRSEDDPNLVPGTVRSHTRPGSNTDATVRQEASVRRLTPTECERLQALPDGWTQIGDTPDSRRYAALGDAVTSTVAEWIGRRIMDAA